MVPTLYTLKCLLLEENMRKVSHESFFLFLQIYQGNNDRNSAVVNALKEPIEARFIRLHPYAWYGHISLRMEFHGCSLKPGKVENLRS